VRGDGLLGPHTAHPVLLDLPGQGARVSEPRILLGSWTCPSGNSCDVFLRPEAPGIDQIMFEWDAPPPLLPPDEQYYVETILPELTGRIAALQERPLESTLVLRSNPGR
jgi:hypothetical protein